MDGFARWILVLGVAFWSNSPNAQLWFEGDFESGQIQPKDSTRDGFFVKTLPDPQGNTDQFVVAKGGAGPNSGLDTRVMSSEIVGSTTVRPRRGNYFLRSAIYFNKDYTGFSGNSDKNKPRSNMNLNAHPFDYDTEGYVGFSIFVPSNFENETGKTGPQGQSMLLTVGAPSAQTFYNMGVWVPRGKTKAHWFIRLQTSDFSVGEGGASAEEIDIGPVEPDKGKWTDFVIRFRSNPFSEDTNPAKAGIANAKSQLYLGNRGILQVWKADGPVDASGNRKMVQKLSRVNTPVGLVPHKSWKLDQSFRIYKYGWHQQPTSVKGPVWFGFDEIRFGLVERDGTSYADVHPAGLPCTDGCPNGTSISSPDVPEPVSSPRPPEGLTISR